MNQAQESGETSGVDTSPWPPVSTTRPYYEDEGVVIYHGDALDVLDDLTEHTGFTVDAIVTDPPYASGGRTEASRPGGGGTVSHKSMDAAERRSLKWASAPITNDQMTTVGFVWLLRHVALATRDTLRDGGSFVSFIDWRQWPNLVGALETANLRIQGMVVWDKGSFALGNGFRAQHELICHASKGVPIVHDRGVGNVLRAARPDATDHPTPKPVDLVERLLAVVSAPGEVVLDPFMGAGSIVAAGRATGRRIIGIEQDERYCEIAAHRVGQARLFDEASA